MHETNHIILTTVAAAVSIVFHSETCGLGEASPIHSVFHQFKPVDQGVPCVGYKYLN